MLADLRPGDVLLYGPEDLVGLVIAAKGLTRFAHAEVYAGGGWTFAARRSHGCTIYKYTTPEAVYRLRQSLDFAACERWYFRILGQPYDTAGVLLNPIAKYHGRENGKQFCSELTARLLRQGCATDPFEGRDADGLHPGDFARFSSMERVK